VNGRYKTRSPWGTLSKTKDKGGGKMAENGKKLILIDVQWYLGADQSHFMIWLKRNFPETPIYFAINRQSEYWSKVGDLLTKIYKKNGVKLLDAKKLKLSMVKHLVHGLKSEELIIGTNDEEALSAVAKDKTLKTTYLRITYKKNRDRWSTTPLVFQKLQELGYTVINVNLASWIEGKLARILGLHFEEALKLWDEREKFSESVQTVRKKVLPKIAGEITLENFKSMCVKEGIAHPLESTYLLAYYGDIKLVSVRGNVLLLRNANTFTETETEDQESSAEGILSKIFQPFLRFFPKSEKE
jgi:hypothetical protein